MAAPLAIPLLSLGIELIDKFFINDKDKIETKDKLISLESQGKIKELESEVKRLRDITSIDTSYNSSVPSNVSVPVPDLVANISKSVPDKTNKWKDTLGTLVAYAFGFNLLGIPVINQSVHIHNSIVNNIPIPTMASLSFEEMIYAFSMLVGVGGVSLIQKNIDLKSNAKQWFGK